MAIVGSTTSVKFDVPSTVVRRLFEETSRENVEQNLANEELKVCNDRVSAQRFAGLWGFDPILGVPVEGAKYECREVDPSKEYIPSFYTKGYAPRLVRVRERSWSPYNKSILGNLDKDSHQLTRPVKRRLPLDDDEGRKDFNDENKPKVDNICVTKAAKMSRVPEQGEKPSIDSSSSSPSSIKDSPTPHLHRSSSLLAMPGLAESIDIQFTRCPDAQITPVNQKTHTQSSIKEYLPLKKKRSYGGGETLKLNGSVGVVAQFTSPDKGRHSQARPPSAFTSFSKK